MQKIQVKQLDIRLNLVNYLVSKCGYSHKVSSTISKQLQQNKIQLHELENISTDQLCHIKKLLSGEIDSQLFIQRQHSKKQKYDQQQNQVIVPQTRKPILKLTLTLKNNCITSSLAQLDTQLPIVQYQNQIINALQNNNIIILKALTGSGKSTQISFILYNYNIKVHANCQAKIIITQPRRISCIQLAQYVQKQATQVLPNNVDDNFAGYQVRFMNTVNTDTKSAFVTDGILIAQIQQQTAILDYLNMFKFIVLDEAHELSTGAELIFALLRHYSRLNMLTSKIIIMSASINTNQFVDYFFSQQNQNLKIQTVDIPGKLYNIEKVYIDCSQEIQSFQQRINNGLSIVKSEIETLVNYLQDVYNVNIKQGMETNSNQYQKIDYKYLGTLIFFLPGEQEINYCIQQVQNYIQDNFYQDLLTQSFLLVLPLHSKLDQNSQNLVFSQVYSSNINSFQTIKIIFSTNIAETSITIDNCSCVVDSGLVKLLNYNQTQHCNVLQTENIDLNNMQQRMGRAGRQRDGVYYMCFNQFEQSQFLQQNKAEIQRVQFDQILLKIIHIINQVNNSNTIEVEQIFEFQLIHKLLYKQVCNTIQRMTRLKLVKLIDQQQKITSQIQLNSRLVLTNMGIQAANDPVDVQFSILLSFVRKYKNNQLYKMFCMIASYISCGFQFNFRELQQKYQDQIKVVYNDFLMICQMFDQFLFPNKQVFSFAQQQFIINSYNQLLEIQCVQHNDLSADDNEKLQLLDINQKIVYFQIQAFPDNIAQYDSNQKCYKAFQSSKQLTSLNRQSIDYYRKQQQNRISSFDITQFKNQYENKQGTDNISNNLYIHPSSSLFNMNGYFPQFLEKQGIYTATSSKYMNLIEQLTNFINQQQISNIKPFKTRIQGIVNELRIQVQQFTCVNCNAMQKQIFQQNKLNSSCIYCRHDQNIDVTIQYQSLYVYKSCGEKYIVTQQQLVIGKQYFIILLFEFTNFLFCTNYYKYQTKQEGELINKQIILKQSQLLLSRLQLLSAQMIQVVQPLYNSFDPNLNQVIINFIITLFCNEKIIYLGQQSQIHYFQNLIENCIVFIQNILKQFCINNALKNNYDVQPFQMIKELNSNPQINNKESNNIILQLSFQQIEDYFLQQKNQIIFQVNEIKNTNCLFYSPLQLFTLNKIKYIQLFNTQVQEFKEKDYIYQFSYQFPTIVFADTKQLLTQELIDLQEYLYKLNQTDNNNFFLDTKQNLVKNEDESQDALINTIQLVQLLFIENVFNQKIDINCYITQYLIEALIVKYKLKYNHLYQYKMKLQNYFEFFLTIFNQEVNTENDIVLCLCITVYYFLMFKNYTDVTIYEVTDVILDILINKKQ